MAKESACAIERRETDLCALLVLETFLENREDGICLEVHDEIGTACKDAEGGLAGVDVRTVCHGKGLRLEGMPGTAAFHGIV